MYSFDPISNIRFGLLLAAKAVAPDSILPCFSLALRRDENTCLYTEYIPLYALHAIFVYVDIFKMKYQLLRNFQFTAAYARGSTISLA
jgi:hypothetical protein